jgi:hypothetical protein
MDTRTVASSVPRPPVAFRTRHPHVRAPHLRRPRTGPAQAGVHDQLHLGLLLPAPYRRDGAIGSVVVDRNYRARDGERFAVYGVLE